MLPALCCAQEEGEVAPADKLLAAPTTGMEAEIFDHLLPGSQLEVKALESTNSPIVLRVVQVFPNVDDWRYDFSFYGTVPGKYDLRDFLQRSDGSSMEDVPPIPIEVLAMRPPGELVKPTVEPERPPRFGGYQLALMVLGGFWFVVLLMLIFGFRKKTDAQIAQRGKPVTLADQLRPLLKQAQSGELSQTGQAELERKLLGIWRKRLKLDGDEPGEAMIKLRKHEEAGALLRELEKWLHRPGSADDVDVAELLKPYEQLPPE